MAATISWLGAALLGLVAVIEANGVVQLLTVALIVSAAVPVLRSRTKDSTIEALRESAEARAGRIKDLEADLRGCRDRADSEHSIRLQSERRIAKLEGQLEEQAKYTAKEAFEVVAVKLGSIEALLQAWLVRDAAKGLDAFPPEQ